MGHYNIEVDRCVCSAEDNGYGHVIHVDCASHIYPDGTIGIHDMCFRVHEKEIVAVCGANGSGKSTLLEHLNGLLLPSSGKIYVMGCAIEGDMKRNIWRYVGIVFQKPDDQLFAPTVLDDVMFGPINMGMSIERAREVAMEALEQVGVAYLADKVPNYLSGGQKRLVSIAGILAMKPRVIAMDEPTADLDACHCEKIEQIIFGLRDHFNISIVIATHDLDMASRLADRVFILKKGSVIAEGKPRDIFYNETLLADAGLAPPNTVDIYLDYCDRYGIKAGEKPLTTDELITAIGNMRPVLKH